ncbi:DUF4468 domain-containing protein [Hymenobacter nivis]|uniref:DUF4468 domain-containing protein n=1 Tax=Hymenobacter nivis TaxID=1850093 RepID=A0A502GTQ9_9BACT|nr:DUF4468 domain-containing protein [Hymenobacter nivis]TPG65787.1 DUF4468 domain-containing protein [Hymenobacter nivis]
MRSDVAIRCRGLWAAGALLLASRPAGAQALPLDAQGKVSFYYVVAADSLAAGALYGHAKGWLRQRGYALTTADSAAGRLVATNALAVYDRGYLSKKLHGKVRYQLAVDVKEGRYRLQFSGFVFEYYQEDHAYHFVPTGKTKPLEDTQAPGWQKLWQSHRQDALLGINGLVAELKAAMRAAPAPPPAPPAARAADW